MKKRASIALLGILIGFVLMHIAKNNTRTTQMNNISRISRECATSDTELQTKWSEFSNLLNEGMKQGVNSEALRKEALAEARSGVRATRHWINECGHIMPEASAEYIQMLNNLVPEIHRLEKLK